MNEIQIEMVMTKMMAVEMKMVMGKAETVDEMEMEQITRTS